MKTTNGWSWVLVAALAAGCGGVAGSEGSEGHGGGRRGGPGDGFAFGGAPGGDEPAAAVPVEVAPVARRSISAYIESHCTLEAENEVDIVARTSGPVVELRAEEGLAVDRGELLARLDDDEIRAQLETARVSLKEAELALQRAERLRTEELIPEQEHEQARSRFETAQAQVHGSEVLLAYTEIRAPFAGLIVERYVKFAQHVTSGTQLFRLSDFDPLLCPIQVPERELPRLAPGQGAELTVESYPGERFQARVLRVRPVIDAATGTVEVTLEAEGRRRLRPGMFSSVFLQTESRDDALVIPKTALSLESIGDTVYVADGAEARRREVTLGFRQGELVEVVEGLREGERVIVIGQDSVTDGTPIQVLGPGAPPAIAEEPGWPQRRGFGDGSFGGGRFDPSQMSPEQLERIKTRMRERGLTDEQIEERLRRFREPQGGSGR